LKDVAVLVNIPVCLHNRDVHRLTHVIPKNINVYHVIINGASIGFESIMYEHKHNTNNNIHFHKYYKETVADHNAWHNDIMTAGNKCVQKDITPPMYIVHMCELKRQR